MAPILILATNRGITTIRGTKYQSPHGIPVDFLDRLLIIPTDPYKPKEIRQILKIRCEEEDVDITEEAMELLTTIAGQTSMRYAMNMIITSSLAARKRKSNTVGVEDVKRVFGLFSDVGRSTKTLQEYQDSYLYSETKYIVYSRNSITNTQFSFFQIEGEKDVENTCTFVAIQLLIETLHNKGNTQWSQGEGYCN